MLCVKCYYYSYNGYCSTKHQNINIHSRACELFRDNKKINSNTTLGQEVNIKCNYCFIRLHLVFDNQNKKTAICPKCRRLFHFYI